MGGIGAGEGNVVAFNAGAGVFVVYSTINIFHNPIRGNSIYGNGTANGANGLSTLGIDLGNPGGFGQGGFTPNDLGDADIGPNLNQNFPLLVSAVSAGGKTTIDGVLNSTPSTQFAIDFYSNDACVGRPQDFLQGRTYLGATKVDDERQRQCHDPRGPAGCRPRGRREGHGHRDGSRRQHVGVLAAVRPDGDALLGRSRRRFDDARRISLSRRRDRQSRRRRRDQRQRRRRQPDHPDDAVPAARKPQRHRRHRTPTAASGRSQRLDRGLPRRAGRPAVL